MLWGRQFERFWASQSIFRRPRAANSNESYALASKTIVRTHFAVVLVAAALKPAKNEQQKAAETQKSVERNKKKTADRINTRLGNFHFTYTNLFSVLQKRYLCVSRAASH